MRQGSLLGKDVEAEQGCLWGGEGGEGAKKHYQGWCEFPVLPPFFLFFILFSLESSTYRPRTERGL